ncbi:MAG: PKD domain-containing protein [Candidatus Thermoplasmatota archaeon]|nr:PKD domain-containing protein [Candidatus Thermoplasmatota archaeon]MBS3802729.1 PKD domain-containing protein [Candidatus Thermoplasmatota archaeon]
MGEVGWYSTLVIHNNRIYISYYDMENSNLRLVSQKSEKWNIEVIDEQGDVGMYNCLVIDTDGIIHISYYDKTNGNLKYAKKSGEIWEYDIVDEMGNTGLDTAIALDKNQNVHISYYDGTESALKHATKINNNWEIETIDNNGNVGCGSSIKIDSNDVMHISYTDNDKGALWYAKGTLSNWETNCIDNKSLVFGSTAISLDNLGNPHICYYDVPNPTEDWSLKYATKNGEKWLLETIDPNLKYFWNEWGCSIDVDDFNRVHVGYYAWQNWNINYALKTTKGWEVEIVKSEGSVGGYASIDVNESGYPHLSFMDMNEFSLNYAKKLNFHPEKPNRPVGRKIGIVNNTYEFETKTTDFDEDTISYMWNWGDESSTGWSPYFQSDENIKMSHTWSEKGTYYVRVKAKDENGLESIWSDPIKVVQTKNNKRPIFSSPLIERLITSLLRIST